MENMGGLIWRGYEGGYSEGGHGELLDQGYKK